MPALHGMIAIVVWQSIVLTTCTPGAMEGIGGRPVAAEVPQVVVREWECRARFLFLNQ